MSKKINMREKEKDDRGLGCKVIYRIIFPVSFQGHKLLISFLHFTVYTGDDRFIRWVEKSRL